MAVRVFSDISIPSAAAAAAAASSARPSIQIRISHASLHSSLFRRFLKAPHCKIQSRQNRSVKVFASLKGNRKERRRPSRNKKRELELNFDISIEERLTGTPHILEIVEVLHINAPVVMKVALGRLKDSEYQTRDSAVKNIASFENVELSMLLCNDEFIKKLNSEWRGEDSATDVLSVSQHIPQLKLSTLMLGDVVISVETAKRQAEERGHTLLDEMQILMVHGLLHLLGFDHEISEEAEKEMEKEEEFLLESLGWKGKGLINSSINAHVNIDSLNDRKSDGYIQVHSPKFTYIFCDMDGTLLNSKSQITSTTVEALREALSRGIKVVIATGKTRPAAITILERVGLSGKDGIVSEYSPGVFTQGLLVYGREGREILRSNLDIIICIEAFVYSIEHRVPVVAYSEDRCLTLFDHPFVDSLHTTYYEPKAEIMPSIEDLLAGIDVQKLIFLDTVKGISEKICPYWSEVARRKNASVVQALPDMLEIVPLGTSKGKGVRVLLDHLGVTANQVMAIGDGENDVEMLELAGMGIALSNGSEKAKAAANLIGLTNDQNGVADAIYTYAL